MSTMTKTFVIGGVAAVLVLAIAAPAMANHTIITVRVDAVMADRIVGNVMITNTTPNPQTGSLMVAVVRVGDTAVVPPEVDVAQLLDDFGQIALPANGVVNVPFTIGTVGMTGSLVLAADFKSAVNAQEVPHTHGGTVTVTLP